MVGVITRLWAGQGRNYGLIFARVTDFPVLHTIKIFSVVHPIPFSLGTGNSSLGVKQLGHEADHQHPLNVRVKNEWNYMSMHPYAFINCTGTNLPLQFIVTLFYKKFKLYYIKSITSIV